VSDGDRASGVKRLATRARKLNRNPRLVAAARRTREWAMGEEPLDGVPDVYARLVTTRGRPTDIAVRGLAALSRDSPGVLGELSVTMLQGWQRLAEAQGRGRGEVDVAVLFTDVAGFSSWALEWGDEQAIKLLAQLRAAIEPPIVERRGEVVKRLGDGLMGAFRDAPSATEAAFEGRERAASIEVAGYRPRLRTGIHLGRPRKVGRDYLGVDVNIAARLAEAASPGEILVSDRTFQALDPATVTAVTRPFAAKGAPADLAVHALEQRR
jgi:adenylate cyclase